MDISEALRKLFGSDQKPSLNLEQALIKRLGKPQNGMYSKKAILEYLQISRSTYKNLTESEFGQRKSYNLEKTASVIIKIESSLTLEERLFEELLFVLENPAQ